MSVGLSEVRAAAAGLQGRVHRTPVVGSRTLGSATGARVRLKLENFQRTGSFKPRGALNHLLRVSPERLARGVVTVSAGNHAQAVAYAGRCLGVPTTVVMMAGASEAKLAATRGYGARVEIVADGMAGFARVRELEQEQGLYFIHPFDHPDTVAGAGTVGLEIFEDVPEVDVVVVGIGGGGLISGTALALKELKPSVRVIGVEPEGADVMTRSLEAGRVMRMEHPRTIADGLAAPFVGELNLALTRRYVDGVVLVSDAEIRAAMRMLLERCKLLAEPAGAAALAAVCAGRAGEVAGRDVVVVVSGGNIGPEVAMRLMCSSPDELSETSSSVRKTVSSNVQNVQTEQP